MNMQQTDFIQWQRFLEITRKIVAAIDAEKYWQVTNFLNQRKQCMVRLNRNKSAGANISTFKSPRGCLSLTTPGTMELAALIQEAADLNRQAQQKLAQKHAGVKAKLLRRHHGRNAKNRYSPKTGSGPRFLSANI